MKRTAIPMVVSASIATILIAVMSWQLLMVALLLHSTTDVLEHLARLFL